MSSSRSAISYPGVNATHSNSRALAWTIGVVVMIGIVVVIIQLMAQLNAMSNNLVQVRSRLDTLTTMNQKLDTLNGMSATLRHMNAKLSVTNSSLQSANDRLSAMERDSKAAGVSLGAMHKTLKDMQGDIHTMSHKISGSFLFRSIK